MERSRVDGGAFSRRELSTVRLTDSSSPHSYVNLLGLLLSTLTTLCTEHQQLTSLQPTILEPDPVTTLLSPTLHLTNPPTTATNTSTHQHHHLLLDPNTTSATTSRDRLRTLVRRCKTRTLRYRLHPSQESYEAILRPTLSPTLTPNSIPIVLPLNNNICNSSRLPRGRKTSLVLPQSISTILRLQQRNRGGGPRVSRRWENRLELMLVGSEARRFIADRTRRMG